jgi:hypothetical protein
METGIKKYTIKDIRQYCKSTHPSYVTDSKLPKRLKEKRIGSYQYNKIIETLEIDDEESILIGINKRANELKLELDKHDIKLRDTNSLCQRYIYRKHGRGNIEDIVERLCKIKFLFEYCNLVEFMNDSVDDYAEFINHYDKYDGYGFNELDFIFYNTEYICYPKVYPWILEKKYNKAAKVIQKYLYNWLWKPVTKDGKLGINARISLRKSDMGDFLYASEIN